MVNYQRFSKLLSEFSLSLNMRTEIKIDIKPFKLVTQSHRLNNLNRIEHKFFHENLCSDKYFQLQKWRRYYCL